MNMIKRTGMLVAVCLLGAQLLHAGTVTIDVMVVYTPAARDYAGGGAQITNIILEAMSKAQLTHDNSGTLITKRLVHAAEVSYLETGDSITDLIRLQDPSGGYMDEIHDWRDEYGADLVAFFAFVHDTGGLGYLLNTTNGSPDYAFSLTRVQQASSTYTHIHEMGHNMGAHHHKEQNVQPGPTVWSDWPENSWSAGWRWVGNDDERYCSVMTYDSGDYFADGSNHVMVAYFSNPDVNYQGVPTGHAVDGDNARTLREVRRVVAAYRAQTVATPAFDPDGGAHPGSSVNVTITCATDGATIRYTTDGSNPTKSSPTITSGGSVSVPLPRTLKARAWKAGMNSSAIKSASYTTAPPVATPAFDPDGGAHPGSGVNVTITCATGGATIRYTTDGSNPTESSPAITSGGSVSVPVPGTLKARAWKAGMNSSAIKSANYVSRTRIIRLSGNLNFGDVSIGSSATRTLTIHNDGNSTLRVSSINYPSGFSGNWNAGKISAGGSENVTVTFSPAEEKSYSGTITVNSDKTSGTNGRSCSGTGVIEPTRIIRLSGSLNFGNVPVGISARRTFTIHNDGNSVLTVKGISHTEFMPPVAWSGTIAPGESHDLAVMFSPTKASFYLFSLRVLSDSTSGENSMKGSGMGVIGSAGTYQPISGDFDGDGKSDYAVFNQDTGLWYILSNAGTVLQWELAWGWPGAVPVPGDYNGDGMIDFGVFDENTGYWYVLSADQMTTLAWELGWGWPGAVPVPGDYNGDGRNDYAVFCQNTGLWFVLSADQSTILAWGVDWGWPGAQPVSGDYNGDGRNDYAVFCQNTGLWFVLSADQTTILAWGVDWGWPGAIPVSGDYNGDGRSDYAVFCGNTGLWFVLAADQTTILAWGVDWGWPGALPVSGDYNGDGRSDFAIFCQNTGLWYVLSSDQTTILAWGVDWGWPGAIPPGAL